MYVTNNVLKPLSKGFLGQLLNIGFRFKIVKRSKNQNMSYSLTTVKFFATVALAAAVIFGGAFAVTSVKAQAVSLSELVELFISLGIISADKADAARSALSSSTSGGSTSGATCSTTFTRNLKQGSTGAEVMDVQKFLNNNGFTVSTSGAGSAGNETSYFGPATKAAAINFQEAYTADILTPVGLTSGTGYWGASSRAKANSMCAGTTPTPPGTVTGMLNVNAASQPANSLAPQGASRVPFTKFTLTNGSTAAVSVNGVTVELTGLSQNAAFAGVTLVDSNNIQYGIAKTLNSNHQAVIGDTFTLNAGETKTFTVAGNMAAALTSYAGQVASLSVVGVNTSSTVSGSFPITGASHTMNASLAIGSVSTSTSAYDPAAAQSKNIGDTSVRFSGVRFTASSAEDLRLYSVRWRNAGTASASDISNLMTYVDSTAYPTSVDATGKYYTVVFPAGVLIEKGFSKDIYVQGDISGAGAAGRTVIFDIDKASDVYFIGQTFGYGVAVTGTWSPWFSGYTTSVTAGTATSIAKANEVAAQNIAVNVTNQPLGGFATEFKGEAVSVQSIIMTYATTTASVGLITSATLVDGNGAVVAGPVDATWVGTTATFSFSDTVTFPVGRQVYTVKGKIPAAAGNNATVAVSTTPNSTNWTTATGQTSGNTITLPGVAVTMNTMTVKSGAVALSVSATPAAQNVVAGVTGFTVANIQLDATQSGEDIRFANMKVYHTETSLTGGDIVNCFAYDGATRLNDSAVNPTTTLTDYTYVLSNNLLVSKGTVKTVAIKCDIPAAITSGSFSEGQNGTVGFTGTGIQSGNSITPTITATAAGQTLTVQTGGALTVVADSSTPTYTVAAAGTAGVTLGILKFHATNEDIRLDRVALQMSNVAATSSPSDLSQVTLWANGVQVGTALFTGSSRVATSSLTSTVTVPKDGDLLVTIKGDLAAVGTSLAGTEGALLQVDYDGDDSTGTKGTGMSSGSAINQTSSSDTSFAGVRMFKSFPTIAHTGVNGTLSVGTGVTLDKFTITANSAGGISLYKVTTNVATSAVSTASGTTSVTNLKVYAYTNSSYSNPVSGYTNGQVVATASTVNSGDNESVLSSVLNIPAGTTYYFAVKGDVAQVAGTTNNSGYVTTKIGGDIAFPVVTASLMGTGSVVDGDTNNNFVWSPNSTTTSLSTHVDWTNGYLISGLPTDYLQGTTLSK